LIIGFANFGCQFIRFGILIEGRALTDGNVGVNVRLKNNNIAIKTQEMLLMSNCGKYIVNVEQMPN